MQPPLVGQPQSFPCVLNRATTALTLSDARGTSKRRKASVDKDRNRDGRENGETALSRGACMQLRREKLDVNTWSHLAVRTPPCRFQQSAALAPLFGALGTGNANGERWSDSGAKVPRKIKGPKFWSRLLSRHSLCSQAPSFTGKVFISTPEDTGPAYTQMKLQHRSRGPGPPYNSRVSRTRSFTRLYRDNALSS